jgi:hypothetical protein
MFRILLPLVVLFATFIGSGEMIYACVADSDGGVRIVMADEPCLAGEHAVQWGIIGLQGPAGVAGPPGPTGAAGVGDLGCTNGQLALWNDVAEEWQCSTPPDVAALNTRIAALEGLFAGVTRSADTLLFSGVNLQVVDGSGSTDGGTNGLGNVIIGYNESRPIGNFREGSHMLVMGMRNNYTGFGGIIVGNRNSVSAPYSAVLGGSLNVASAEGSVVSGGYNNSSSGEYASVSGGSGNTASGPYSSVSAGNDNTANDDYASVSGGSENTASATSSTVSGGQNNQASGTFATVSGGGQNIASGLRAVVSGGYDRDSIGSDDWVAGSLIENQ